MDYKSLGELTGISGKRVLVRVDFNVPIREGKVADDFRLQKTLPTIKHLLSLGTKVILISHIDSKEGGTLKPVADYLSGIIPLYFTTEKNLKTLKENSLKMESGTVVLPENLRKHEGEEKNDEDFAEELAELGDYYVNEAFSVSHRLHASIVGVPKYLPSFAGFLFEREIKELSRAFNPPHPFLFILGGAKFQTKQPLVEKFLNIADDVFVGGALGNDFFKALGCEVGGSITSGVLPPEEIVNHQKIMIPIDVVVRASDGRRVIRAPDQIKPQEIVSDAGPETLENLRKKITAARMVLWNGPLGLYERGFDMGTKEVARMLSGCRARSIVGGGDTIAAIKELGIEERFSFVSTGGGAMLEFLAKGTLPGIEALQIST